MTPNTRRGFWDEKFRRTVQRGEAVEAEFWNMGWEVFVDLECKTCQSTELLGRLLAPSLTIHGANLVGTAA